MKPGKIKVLWSLSIIATFMMILLQGYWLYNQYKLSLEKGADEISQQIVVAWDDYKAWQKDELQKGKNDKSNDSVRSVKITTVFMMDEKKDNTDWTVSMISSKSDSVFAKSDNAERNRVQHIVHAIDTTGLSDGFKGGVKNKRVVTHDSTIVNTFRFRTGYNRNLVYDAVDLYISDANSPFNPNKLDSIIRQQAGNVPIRIDTLSLPADSVLWQPQTIRNLSLTRPSLSVDVPYNILMQKVARVTVPLVPASIMKTMALQIIAALLLLVVLVVCLLLQIQTISKQLRISKLRQNFVNTTIHELKRPVQTLKTIVSYLQHSAPEDAEILNEARIETDNLTSYLQKLREVNHAETIGESMDFAFFDFTVLANECVAGIEKDETFSGRINTDFPHGQPLSIIADRMVLGTVIVNLLENAVKYSGENPQINFRATLQNNQLLFSICDNGIGIAPSEQNHVFEPFFRSKNSFVTSRPGMGLGLSYVKMAVEAHRGTIELQSAPNNGTTITIKLPQQ